MATARRRPASSKEKRPRQTAMRAKPGAGTRGVDFRLDAPLPAYAAEAKGVDLPRPARTRFPIPHDTFLSLKESSKDSKPLALRAASVVRDTSRKRGEMAMAPAAAAAVVVAEPAATPAAVTSFAGLAYNGWLPFDCTLAVGPNHVLASVNAMVGVFDKTSGTSVVQRTLATWFANVVRNAKIFDPKALYDQHAGRWVLLAVALAENPNRSWFLLSISKSSDPSAGWRNYAIDASKDGKTKTNNWADYPSLGVDSQALYVTANMFRFGGNFQYAKVRVIPKKGPYSGGSLTYSDIVNLKNADGSPAFTVQPCHTFGAPGVEYLVNSVYPDGADATKNTLSLWTLRDPLGTPAVSRSSITTDPYALPPDAVQKGGGTPLDTGDVRVLNAVFNGGSVWCAFTTRHVWSAPPNTAAAHWFQINASTGALVQQGIFGAQGSNYYYPAVMPDVHGNMTMVFSRSGPTEFASIYFTGRAASDAPGTLQNSALLKAGAANYLGLDNNGRNRWGDYAGIGLDPTDSRTVNFYSGFALTKNQWGSWIGGTRF